jgi:hypothetical protein
MRRLSTVRDSPHLSHPAQLTPVSVKSPWAESSVACQGWTHLLYSVSAILRRLPINLQEVCLLKLTLLQPVNFILWIHKDPEATGPGWLCWPPIFWDTGPVPHTRLQPTWGHVSLKDSTFLNQRFVEKCLDDFHSMQEALGVTQPQQSFGSEEVYTCRSSLFHVPLALCSLSMMVFFFFLSGTLLGPIHWETFYSIPSLFLTLSILEHSAQPFANKFLICYKPWCRLLCVWEYSELVVYEGPLGHGGFWVNILCQDPVLIWNCLTNSLEWVIPEAVMQWGEKRREGPVNPTKESSHGWRRKSSICQG